MYKTDMFNQILLTVMLFGATVASVFPKSMMCKTDHGMTSEYLRSKFVYRDEIISIDTEIMKIIGTSTAPYQ